MKNMGSTFLVFILALTACVRGLSFTANTFKIAENTYITFDEGVVHFSTRNKGNGATLRSHLGVFLPKEHKLKPEECSNGSVKCIKFGNSIRLNFVRDIHCDYFNWTTSENLTLGDCFDYGTANWYGGPENYYQYWPFNNMTFKNFPYVTTSHLNTGIAEPYWVTSSGFYIYVDKRTPLFVDANNDFQNGLCLISKQYPPYLPRGGTFLGYKICKYNNSREAHLNAVRNDLGAPKGIPDARMIKHPIWSTWARYKWNVNETAVKLFAQEILKNGFNNSQIEIDDDWETCYGSAEFNRSRFRDMPSLGKTLHSLGFRTTLWNHPFVNVECPLFATLKEKGYLVRDQSGNVSSHWWDGDGGVVDFTNPEAAQWYLDYRWDMMTRNHIDGLKLDAGETSWLPQIPQLNASVDDQPSAYTVAYARTVSQFGPLTELRVGHGTQDLPVFVRMLDKDSKWTFDNGLPTLLTTLLQLNLNGYTLVLPDMVGGNAYNKDKVSKELFIRWLQANTFMPAIQFSIAPFDFDEETVNISKKFTALHSAYASQIMKVMRRCVRNGNPVNPPIWWVAPTDPVAHSVWDEFLLGEKTLVAPVVKQGDVSRDIYLPCGKWRDEADPNHVVYDGPQWLKQYPAPLDVLPYFTNVHRCRRTRKIEL